MQTIKEALQILFAPLFVALTPLKWMHTVGVKLFVLLGSIMGLLATLGMMLWAFVELNGGLDSITASINGTAAMLRTLPMGGTVNMLNRVFPLNEFLVMEGLLMGIYLACVLVRWIRSFLPTIN